MDEIELSLKIFNDKKKNIQDIHNHHLCNYCGSCKLICPVEAIEYNDGEIFVNNNCIFCEKCLDICSQNHEMKFSSNLFEYEDNSKIEKYDRKMRTVPFGKFREIFICESSDPDIRSNAMVGGSTLSLLKTALNIGYIDTALVADFSDGNQFPSGKIVKSEKELLKTGGSKYLPTLSLERLLDILKDDDISSVAITTLPCQAYVLEKMRLNKATENFVSKIKLVITLFCGNGVPSRDDMEKFFNKKGIVEPLSSFTAQRKIIKKFWRINPQNQQRYIYTTKKGEKFNFSSRRILACKPKITCSVLCPDYSGFYSDISVGGAGVKSNIVVVRSERGEKIFREAIGRNNIRKRKFSRLNHFLINLMGRNKRENVRLSHKKRFT